MRSVYMELSWVLFLEYYCDWSSYISSKDKAENVVCGQIMEGLKSRLGFVFVSSWELLEVFEEEGAMIRSDPGGIALHPMRTELEQQEEGKKRCR